MGQPVPLQLIFTYHPEAGYAPIREITDNWNFRVKEFYWRTWFGDEKMHFEQSIANVFDGGEAIVTGKAIDDFIHVIGNNNESFVRRKGKKILAPMDFAMAVGWKTIIKPLFTNGINGDLLKLVHLSNAFRMIPGTTPIEEGDRVETTSQVNAVAIQNSGKMVEVCCTITRNGAPVMTITSQFLYRGIYTDFENTFQRSSLSMQMRLNSSKDVAILRSKNWFVVEKPDYELLGQVLIFYVETYTSFKSKTVLRSVHTRGQVFLELPSNQDIQIGTVEYTAGESSGNPVVSYLQRHGNAIRQPVIFKEPIPLSSEAPLIFKAPMSNDAYARVSGDFNPIHVSRLFSELANLPGTITHGMYTSAAVRSLVEIWAGESKPGRVHSFYGSLVGMVLPNDQIEVQLQHVGMFTGRKVIKVEAKKRTGKTVLLGEAEVEQSISAYVFTGQGSQKQGMGMDLYASSAVVRDVWHRGDRYFLENYGPYII
jgi:fatty acid synthase subunit beta, fungi type